MCDLYNMSNDYKANKMTSFSLNFRVRRTNSSMCHTQRCPRTISVHCLASGEATKEALSREAFQPENTPRLFRGTGAGMQLYQVEQQFFTVLKKSVRFSGLAFLRGTFLIVFYLLMPLTKLLLMQDRIRCLGHSCVLSYLFSPTKYVCGSKAKFWSCNAALVILCSSSTVTDRRLCPKSMKYNTAQSILIF